MADDKDVKRLKNIWSCMRQRCNNPNHTAARWYHDKGIRVCSEWENSFQEFMEWSMTHGYAEDLTIDRIDSGGDYCPGNCQWITRSENSRRAGIVTCKAMAPGTRRILTEPKYEVYMADTWTDFWHMQYCLFHYSEDERFKKFGTPIAEFGYYHDAVKFRNQKQSEQPKHHKRYSYRIIKVGAM